MDPSAGVVLGSKYELVRPLASGGMGSVWVARHIELDTQVAVKLIAWVKALQPTTVERFRREARTAAQLKSVHIVSMLDYGVEGGVPYMVMELLHGEDLDAHLARVGRLGVERALAILRPICKALSITHDAGLVHRDIKPANVFLARIGGDEVVKLVDFGIAREERPAVRLTGTAQLVGSPSYMSPEQFTGGDITRRSDLWSLALVAFEMLTGTTAIDATSLAELNDAIVRQPMPTLAARLPELASLDPFFARAFSRAPSERFPDAMTFLAELERAARQVDARAPIAFADTVSPELSARQHRSDAPTLEAAGASVVGSSVDGGALRVAPPLDETLAPSTGNVARSGTKGKALVLAAGAVVVAGAVTAVVLLGGSKQTSSGTAAPETAARADMGDGARALSSGGLPSTDGPTVRAAENTGATGVVPATSAAPAGAGASSAPSTAPRAAGKRPPSGNASGPQTSAQAAPGPHTTSQVTSDPRWGVPVSK